MSSKMSFNSLCLLVLSLAIPSLAPAQGTLGANDEASAGYPKVVMRTTMGDMVIELDAERAPNTVDNFLAYVDDNFYTDTVFHRVIEGFMIQGGGFSTSFQRKTTRPPVSNEAYNGLRNIEYSIAMARTTAPHSATSQFFINTEDNRNLDHTDTSPRGWGYTVFGRVVEGQDVVDAISRLKTGSGGRFSKDVPVEAVVILSVERMSLATNSETLEDVPVPIKGAAAANPAKDIIQDAQTKARPSARDIRKLKEAAPNTDIVNQN